MWHLPKPDLQETLDDVDVFQALGIITSAENPVLKQLVRDYNNQKADLTQQQLSTIPAVTAEKLFLNYNLTYKGQILSGIRTDLCNNIHRCPYCGIGDIESLDHYMNESTYKAMALCRLNLVPMCMECNKNKSTKPYTAFINPYYLLNPGIEFFICNITIIGNDVFYEFSIKDGIFDNTQTIALKKQINAIGLNDRWKKAVISYLQEDIFSEKDTPQLLIAELPMLIQKKKNPKMLNHWKSAVLRGLDQRINGNIVTAQIIIDAVNNVDYN